MAFTGTLDKCKACDKTVYVVDMLSIEGMPYHKTCFRCSHCNGYLVMSNYSSMDGVLYCKTHFEQLFKESGNFSKNFQTAKSSEKQQDLVTLEGECFHKNCFRCAHGGCPLTHSSYAALDGVLYCKHHFARLFMEKGTYSHVLEAAAHKRNASSTPTSPPPEPEPAEPKPEPDDKPAEDQS
ncbi:LIM domain-containing protein PLIM2c-like isoform X2 [Rhodamnia argentea]|uniref:LIM domain-containing protein PLIM2c-like isoform X2 n=1 Tax=Rhodamnia argentea TaxID=178133 RepID=A0A8B8PHF5_9MYRT|nr:LIM domain-containing protein PLIM2c-like isoform X2 [Rhodamnia argentea]